MYSRTKSLLTVGTSAVTSSAVLVQDAHTLSLSLLTVAASVVSVEGSNSEGLAASIPANSWSNMTVLTASGIYAVQPGMRWLRVRQAASSSSATVELTMLVC